ncbi:MAG: S-methyl-5'-thioadenosine phosphorylase [Phycisphaerae bacterium]
MIGLIGGTGLGEALLGDAAGGKDRRVDTPFGQPSGPIRVVKWQGRELAILARHGEGHTLNPSQVPYRANIYALKSLGVTHILASGAVGSLREHVHPRELVVPDQIIDKTYRRSPTFFDEGLAVHCEFAQPYCPTLRQAVLDQIPRTGLGVHGKGTYVCMEGPAFSTQAESHMHRAWGGDLIGMTTMPEAKLAREAEMCYALIALVTDYDCWKPHQPGVSKQALLAEIIGHLNAATANAVMLMRATVEALARSPLPSCECRQALELAIWTDRKLIDRAAASRYGVLLKKYAPTGGDSE